MKTVAPEATGRALCGTSKEDRGPEQGKRPEGHQHSPQTRHPDVDGAEVRKRPSSPTQDWKSARAWILELQLQLILLQMMSLPCSSASGTPDHILSYRLFADYLKTLGSFGGFLFIVLLKDNCFTEFCCFLSNLNMNQPCCCC